LLGTVPIFFLQDDFVAMDRELQSGIKGKIICVVYQSFLSVQKDLYSKIYLLKMCYSIVENIQSNYLISSVCNWSGGEMHSGKHN
jgi:hypothetical protein